MRSELFNTKKHDDGFCLWPTAAPNYTYSVKYTQWGNGKRDIVGEFIQSCKKYGIKPALYYTLATNYYQKVESGGKVLSNATNAQQNYNNICLFQLSELWGNYGNLTEIWFDGGLMPPNQGGPDIVPLLKKLQPDAIAFNAPPLYPQCSRWIGNEAGYAPDPNWSTCSGDGCVEGGSGSQVGTQYCPSECDTPIRGNGAHLWFWEVNTENYVKNYFAIS